MSKFNNFILLKVLVFKHKGDFATISHYLEGFTCICVKFHVQSRYSLGEISEKPAWKLENMVSTIL